MIRVAKIVFLVSALCAIAVSLIGMLPNLPQEVGEFIGGGYKYVAGVPLGMVLILSTLEIGKLLTKEKWNPNTCWMIFVLAMTTSIVAVIEYYYAYFTSDLAADQLHNQGLRVAAVGCHVAFMIKYAAVITRQRLLERVYNGVFFIVVAYMIFIQIISKA